MQQRPTLQVFALNFTPETDLAPMRMGQWQIRATERGLHRVVLPTRHHETFAEDLALITIGACEKGLSSGSVNNVDSSTAGETAFTHLYAAVQQITEYFNGERTHFTVPLDPAPVTSFQSRVHQTIADIPYGCTWSYGQLATAMGEPNAVRAVGTGCGVNPLPVIVPCHRVIRSDGSLGNYTGGVEFKRALLRLENPRT